MGARLNFFSILSFHRHPWTCFNFERHSFKLSLSMYESFPFAIATHPHSIASPWYILYCIVHGCVLKSSGLLTKGDYNTNLDTIVPITPPLSTFIMHCTHGVEMEGISIRSECWISNYWSFDMTQVKINEKRQSDSSRD
jgi:hypothetical protein